MRPTLLSSLPLILAACAGGGDGKTATNTVTRTVTVTGPGDAYPVVDAGEDQVADAGALVTLAGSASDAEGEVTLSWEQRSGTLASLDDPTSATPSFEAPDTDVPQALTWALTATDETGQRTTDVVVVDVVPLPDAPPGADAGPDQRVDEQTVVTLAGAASDAEGAVSTTWTQLAGPPVALSDPADLAASFDAPTTTVVEALLFELSVLDDAGQTSTDSVLVTVDPVNDPPTVATSPQNVVVSTPVSLVAVASDADGIVAEYAWTQLSGTPVTLADADTDTASFTAPAASDVLLFEVTVTDDEGATARDTARVEVTPDPAVNQAPRVDAGPDATVAELGLTALSGTATDLDGTVVSTVWTQISGPTVTLSDPGALTTDFTAPDVGCSDVLVFELSATDDLGAVGTDTVTLVVDGLNGAPTWDGRLLDFEVDDGGLVADTTFELGVPSSGPGVAASGSRVWATNLSGNYPDSTDASLCLPPLDRAGLPDAVLAFQGWLSLSTPGDSLALEVLDPLLGWTPIQTVRPAPSVSIGWSSFGYQQDYVTTLAQLPDLPDPLRLRFHLQTDTLFTGAGLYVDDLVVYSEANDADGDGLVGLIAEHDAHGTDPLDADSDDDGANDGDEVAFGSLPDHPADHPAATVLAPGVVLDFEGTDGGVVGTGPWERGAPSNGPVRAESGSELWASDLSGNYPTDSRHPLFLPPVDLSSTPRPTLTFRAWGDIGAGEAVGLELYDPSIPGWIRLLPDNEVPAATDPLGLVGVSLHSYRDAFTSLVYDLEALAGDPRVRLRLTLYSDTLFGGQGLYLDDLSLHDEADDPDSDTLIGLRDELANHGTDPLLPDTDGDGADDGSEVAMGTEPLNPADFPGGRILQVGDLVDFEVDDGGLASLYDEWQWGSPTAGPLAFSGTRVWATQLGGNHGSFADEALYLPPLDLTTASAPVLILRAASGLQGGESWAIQVWEPSVGWIDAAPLPAYDRSSPVGYAAVSGVTSDYGAVVVDLSSEVGTYARLRVRFVSDSLFSSYGVHLDDLRLVEDGADLDGDGLPSALDEIVVHGTEPDAADTDGDGVDDGPEVQAGTDPTDPLDF